MECTQEIKENIFWLGGSDRRLEAFENMIPLTNGVTYNSYLIMDEKNVLLDTVDSFVSKQFFDNIDSLLKNKKLDYLIINHMEPDHAGNIVGLVKKFPNVKLVGNRKAFNLMEQFFDEDFSSNYYEVVDGEELNIGKHNLKFIFAPMVHWPEVMVTYETTKNILFSADAFGTFEGFSGNLFADQVDFEGVYIDETRRYYSNIVGKYGTQVQNLFKKLENLELKMICPLHGPIWRKNFEYILEKYNKWSTYTPEKEGVVLAYGSMYGNTVRAISIIANKLAEKGVKDIRVYDISKTHPSYIIAEIFKYSNIVIGAPTYNNGLYAPVETLLNKMISLNIQKRNVSLLENGSWAPASGKVMKEMFGRMKDINILSDVLTIKSSVKKNQEEEINNFVDAIYDSLINK